MQLWIEKIYPYAGGLLAAGIWWYLDAKFPDDTGAMLSASLTLGAILTGFLATSKTILIGLRGSAVMDTLRETTFIEELVSYLAAAIWLSFGFSLLALAGFFIKDLLQYFAIVWVAIGVMAALAFVRVTNIILKIIRHDDE